MPADPPSSVVIEGADTDDIDALTDRWIKLASDQRCHGSHLRVRENRLRIREMMVQHVVTDTALIARREGTIVGFITFGAEVERFQQDVTRGIIHNVYVRESDRNEGIGGALLGAAEAALEAEGVDVVALQTMAKNDAARAFYRRHGYAAHRIELEKPINEGTLTTNDG